MPERINDNFRSLAAGSVPFLAGMAAGLGPIKSAAGAIAGIAIDRIVGPSAALAAIMLGISRTMFSIVRNTDLWAAGIARLSRLQNVESQFATIYRSVDRAKEKMKELTQFAVGTPFRIDSVVEAARSLEVLTRGAFAGANALRTVGDVAAATNSSIEETSFWIGKLFNFLQSGRSIRNILFQMQSLGIITGELQNKLEGLEDAGAGFSQKWAAVTNELSRARGGMEDNLKTLSGLQAKLEEVRGQLAGNVAEPFVPIEKESINATIKLLQAVSPSMKIIASDSANVAGVIDGVKNKIKELSAEALQSTGIIDKMWRGFAIAGPAVIAGALAHTINALVGLRGPGNLAAAGAARVAASPPMGFVQRLRIGRARRTGGGLLPDDQVAYQIERSRSASAFLDRRMAGSSFGQAADAFKQGAFLQAGFSAVQALANRAIAVGARANAAGMAALAERTAQATAEALKSKLAGEALAAQVAKATKGVYAASAATALWGSTLVGLKGVFSAVVGVISSVGRALFVLGGGVGLLVRVLVAAGGGLLAYTSTLKRTTEEAEAFSKASGEMNRVLRDQIANIRTAEDRSVALAKAYEALAAAQEKYTKTEPGTQEHSQAFTDIRTAQSSIRVLQRLRGSGLVPNQARTEENLSRRAFEELQLPLIKAEGIARQGTAGAELASLEKKLEILRQQAAFADEIDRKQKEFSQTDVGRQLEKVTNDLANVEKIDFAPLADQIIAAEGRLTEATKSRVAAESKIQFRTLAVGAPGVPTGKDEDVGAYTRAVAAERAARARIEELRKPSAQEDEEKRKKARDEQAEQLRGEQRSLQQQSPIASEQYEAQAQQADEDMRQAQARGQDAVAETYRMRAAALRDLAAMENKRRQAGLEAKQQLPVEELALPEAIAKAQIERSDIQTQRDLARIKEVGNQAEIRAAQIRVDQAKREAKIIGDIPGVERHRVELARLRVEQAERELRLSQETAKQNEDALQRQFTEERRAIRIRDLREVGDNFTADAYQEQLDKDRTEEAVRERLGEAFERGGEPEVARERLRMVEDERARQRDEFEREGGERVQADRSTDAPFLRRAWEARQIERQLIDEEEYTPQKAREAAERQTGVQQYDRSKLESFLGTFREDESKVAEVQSLVNRIQRRATPEEVVAKQQAEANEKNDKTAKTSPDASAITSAISGQNVYLERIAGATEQMAGKSGVTTAPTAAAQPGAPAAGAAAPVPASAADFDKLPPPEALPVVEVDQTQKQTAGAPTPVSLTPETEQSANTFQRPGEARQYFAKDSGLNTVRDRSGNLKVLGPDDISTVTDREGKTREVGPESQTNTVSFDGGKTRYAMDDALAEKRKIQAENTVVGEPRTDVFAPVKGKKLSASQRAAEGLNPGGFFTGTGGGPIKREEGEWQTNAEGITSFVTKKPEEKAPTTAASPVSTAATPQATVTSPTDAVQAELTNQTALLKEISVSLKNSAVLKIK